ncbi:IS110 family RNA-guided transposase [Azospirillum canadense]|uniref:IS110 family transposase n=1 Tax=Azospirillum canadense TaxID=403962 RepID=UPI002226625C|nr:IS110 family transposase [Azospirillum canadense]MCW2240434.1 transposase [Azospirillum canadense]
MELYVGLDVSLDMTAVCVLDGSGKVVWRGRCSSTPDAIAGVVHEHAPAAVRIGLESGLLSTWLVHELRKLGLPVICLDARHAKAALSLQINKTDDNDALGLAQVVRTGWYREVAVKSMDSHTIRTLLAARAHLVSQRQTTANLIRGLLKTFGLLVGQAGGGHFAVRVRELIVDHPALVAIMEPLLTAWQTLREQVADLDRQVRVRARADARVRRLMTAPGVGVVVALAYTAVIDDPARLAKSTSVGAYLGLTPRRYQSGEVDYDGHISRCGDGLLRSYLFEAANVLLSRITKPSWLKTWGEALSKRVGARKAKVAVARKLAVVLHRMWKDEQEFRWTMERAA